MCMGEGGGVKERRGKGKEGRKGKRGEGLGKVGKGWKRKGRCVSGEREGRGKIGKGKEGVIERDGRSDPSISRHALGANALSFTIYSILLSILFYYLFYFSIHFILLSILFSYLFYSTIYYVPLPILFHYLFYSTIHSISLSILSIIRQSIIFSYIGHIKTKAK